MISTGVRTLRSLAIALTLSVAPVAAYAAAPAEADVLANYADLALAGYEDSLSTAKAPPIWMSPRMPGRPPAFPISRPRRSASATRSSMSGKGA